MADERIDLLVPHIQRILDILGEGQEPHAELQETPARFAALLVDRFVPRDHRPLRALATTEASHGPIVIHDIPFYALCAHHIVPFFGTADIAYLPHRHIAGFGAFPRLVDELSRGPHIQETLSQEIVAAITDELHPKGVLVRLQARQMCMELTGACGTPKTITWAASGCYDGADIALHGRSLFTAGSS